MDLDLRGHPLHTRAMSVTLRRGGPGRRDAAASLVDVRKRGFVPSGGDLQSTGLIHHMRVDAEVEESGLRIGRVDVAQPTVAFEPSVLTEGESCRDPVHHAENLVGERLDENFGRRLATSLGGPRSCTHVLSVLRLAGAAVPWALTREAQAFHAPPAWVPGERSFRRDLIFDGAVDGDCGRIAVQLTDLHFRPAPAVARPMERFLEQRELRLLVEVDPKSMEVGGLRGAQRCRGPADFDSASWSGLDHRLAGLEGLRLLPGAAGEVLRHSSLGDEAPLREALMHLTPAWLQCLATCDERFPFESGRRSSLIGLGSTPDACWMWRAGGALDRAR